MASDEEFATITRCVRSIPMQTTDTSTRERRPGVESGVRLRQVAFAIPTRLEQLRVLRRFPRSELQFQIIL